ncbi:MAG: hypothetical protein HKN17_05050 [Rhodothermales bacterium]|nr:hypothetical protein [Rhodothermales bacterium]
MVRKNVLGLAHRLYMHPAFIPVRPIVKLIRYLPDPILVYQMGKVGSTTILRSLKKENVPTFHVHNINKRNRQQIRRIYRQHDARLPAFFHEGRYLRYWLRWSSRQKRIITLVRDPIARIISGKFQTADVRGFPVGDVERAIEALKTEFMEGEGLDYTYRWFSDEIREIIGVDVFDYPFDRDRGYARITTPEADILVMTLERLNNLEGEISEFVGREIRLERSNVEQSDTYLHVKKTFRLPADVVKDVYDTEWIRHFYTPDDVSTFISKWSEDLG